MMERAIKELEKQRAHPMTEYLSVHRNFLMLVFQGVSAKSVSRGFFSHFKDFGCTEQAHANKLRIGVEALQIKMK